MARANPHVLRHRLDDTKLQVIADSASGLEAFASIEKKVMRAFKRHGGWPHRQVNLFVFETLRPLVEQIRAASTAVRAKAPAEARAEAVRHIDELDRKPMVHVYDLANPAECSIFVNRKQMIRLGLWDDKLALEALLAHEHAHPLAENPTTRAARGVRANIAVKALPSGLGANQQKQLAHSLQSIVEEVCLHAPHEVFANELAVRAGFGEALFHLDRISLIEGRAGLAGRSALEAKLRAEVKAGRLSEAGVALTLLMASMEAHIRMALESAAFVRAGESARAFALDALIEEEVFQHVEPEIGALYRHFLSRYASLEPGLEKKGVRAWMGESCSSLLDALDKRGASFKVDFDG